MTRRHLEDYTRVLLVEGYSDLLFYAELLEHVGLHERVFIKPFNGGDAMLSELEAFLSPGELAKDEAIGVIVDADQNPAGRAQAFEERLHAITGHAVKLNAWTAQRPRIGLMVVPGGGRSGEVETLVWDAWSNDPVNASAKSCIDVFVACMAAAGMASRSAEKGKISALLAMRNDDDPRLGPGARAKAFDFERPELGLLIAFLRQLE